MQSTASVGFTGAYRGTGSCCLAESELRGGIVRARQDLLSHGALDSVQGGRRVWVEFHIVGNSRKVRVDECLMALETRQRVGVWRGFHVQRTADVVTS